MKAVIDTCVVIDFLQKREPFAEDAYKIFQLAAKESFLACITAKSATDIYYLMHRCTHSDKEARSKLASLLSFVSMLDSTADDVTAALFGELPDFEDAVMIETAKRSGADCIVTRNIRDFDTCAVPIYTPADFLNILG